MNMNVLIIEDDFRIADIHKEVIEQLDFCKVIHSSLTAKDALTFLKHTDQQPEIILLDIFIPDVKGLELLEKLKKIILTQVLSSPLLPTIQIQYYPQEKLVFSII